VERAQNWLHVFRVYANESKTKTSAEVAGHCFIKYGRIIKITFPKPL
jgi:hypothetical protein